MSIERIKQLFRHRKEIEENLNWKCKIILQRHGISEKPDSFLLETS